MLVDYIKQRQKMLEESNNFYTPSGIHVFTKDAMMNDLVDLETVISDLEAKLPDHIRDGVEMIIVGRFDEFEERGIRIVENKKGHPFKAYVTAKSARYAPKVFDSQGTEIENPPLIANNSVCRISGACFDTESTNQTFNNLGLHPVKII